MRRAWFLALLVLTAPLNARRSEPQSWNGPRGASLMSHEMPYGGLRYGLYDGRTERGLELKAGQTVEAVAWAARRHYVALLVRDEGKGLILQAYDLHGARVEGLDFEFAKDLADVPAHCAKSASGWKGLAWKGDALTAWVERCKKRQEFKHDLAPEAPDAI